jgi:hypothetical protein
LAILLYWIDRLKRKKERKEGKILKCGFLEMRHYAMSYSYNVAGIKDLGL